MQATKPLPEDFNLDNILTTFATDANAREFLESWLWPYGPVCPRCNTFDQSRIAKARGESAREGLYRCNDCRRTFTVTVNSIFEDSHIPIRKWIIALFLISSSKKGFSSLQLQRVLGLGSYRTALFMSHRIRHALTTNSFATKMQGPVEVDECYYGPKTKGKGFRSSAKSAVVALVDRGTGERRSVVVEKLTAANLEQAVRENVEQGATLNTDEHRFYTKLDGDYRHKTVRHYTKEYGRVEKNGEVVTTNYAESSFSLLRRGVIGTFHSISRKHLGLYVAEFDFRFNKRKVTDGERMVAAIGRTRGKRLTYRAIKAKA